MMLCPEDRQFKNVHKKFKLQVALTREEMDSIFLNWKNLYQCFENSSEIMKGSKRQVKALLG